MWQNQEVDMPCDQERKALEAVTKTYAAKRIEHERLTKDEKGVRDLKALNALQKEVDSLQAEMHAKQKALNECLSAQ
jgi:uncharacterized protein (DUF2384 family)